MRYYDIKSDRMYWLEGDTLIVQLGHKDGSSSDMTMLAEDLVPQLTNEEKENILAKIKEVNE